MTPAFYEGKVARYAGTYHNPYKGDYARVFPTMENDMEPSIRLTSFEVAVIGAIAFLLVGYVVLIIAVIWDFCRGPKC